MSNPTTSSSSSLPIKAVHLLLYGVFPLCFFLSSTFLLTQRTLYFKGISWSHQSKHVGAIHSRDDETRNRSHVTAAFHYVSRQDSTASSNIVTNATFNTKNNHDHDHNITEPTTTTNANDINDTAASWIPSSSSSYSTTTSLYRWKSNHGIAIQPLWHWIQQSSKANNNNVRDPYGPLFVWIDPHGSLLVPRHVYRQRSGLIHSRAMYVGPFVQEALYDAFSVMHRNETARHFPYLSQAILQQDGGLPLVLNLADFTGCLYQNYNYTNNGTAGPSSYLADVPMLTLSSSPRCDYAFPMPSYTCMKLAKANAEDWNATFQRSDEIYPWPTKLPKVVWRGVLSDRDKWKNSILEIPRLYINVLAKNHSDIMDVAVVCKDESDLYAVVDRFCCSLLLLVVVARCCLPVTDFCC
jgi:hypothetical protein